MTRLEPDEGEADFHHFIGLPGDKGLLFIVHHEDATFSVHLWADGSRREVLTLPGKQIGHLAYSPTGHLLLTDFENSLWSVPFSLDRHDFDSALASPTRYEQAREPQLLK